MKEMKKNRNSISAGVGYNFCPQCGSQAYAVTTEDEMHRVGCLYCGYMQGVENYIGDCNGEELMELLRKEWNKSCIDSQLGKEFFAAWGASNKGFAITQQEDDYIVYITDEYSEVMEFAAKHQDASYDLYEIADGMLHKLGTTFLVWLTLANNKTK